MAIEKLKADEIIKALNDRQGIVTQAAILLGVDASTVYNYAKRYKTVKTAIEETRTLYDEEPLDEAQIKLREAVRNGESWAIRYQLDKKGLQRGYGDRQKIEHSGSIDFARLSDEELEAIASGADTSAS